MTYLGRYPKEAAHRVLVIEYFVEQHVEELFNAVRQKMTGQAQRALSRAR